MEIIAKILCSSVVVFIVSIIVRIESDEFTFIGFIAQFVFWVSLIAAVVSILISIWM